MYDVADEKELKKTVKIQVLLDENMSDRWLACLKPGEESVSTIRQMMWSLILAREAGRYALPEVKSFGAEPETPKLMVAEKPAPFGEAKKNASGKE